MGEAMEGVSRNLNWPFWYQVQVGAGAAAYRLPGLSFPVRALLATKKDALTVPQRAVQNVQGVYQIAVVRPDDTVDVRPVKLEGRVDTQYVVAEGLQAGERVIVEGGDRVRPGQKVRIASAAPAPAGAGK